MPLTKDDFPEAVKFAETLQQSLMNPADAANYEETSKELGRLNSLITEYEQANRKTDEAGKLLAPPQTAQPATAGPAQKSNLAPSYYFEPSVTEVQNLLRSRPELINQLGLQAWQGIAEPARQQPMPGTAFGQSGGTVLMDVPAKSHIDTMTAGNELYNAVAEHMWKERRKRADERGESITRYKDVPLDLKSSPDLLAGGFEWARERLLSPLTLGGANAALSGQARPGLNALSDLYEYQFQDAGEERAIPRGDDVLARNPGAEFVGNVAGNFSPAAPANVAERLLFNTVANQIERRMVGYGAGQIPGQLMGAGLRIPLSAAVGGAVNAGQGAVERGTQQLANSPAGDWSLTDWEKAARAAGEGAGGDAALGFVMSGVGEGLGTAAESARNKIQRRPDLRDLETVKRGGGDTSVWSGVVAPPNTEAYINQSLGKEFDPNTGQVRPTLGSASALAAEQVLPHIKQSFGDRTRKAKADIEVENEAYFSHPAYNWQRESATPAIESLIDLAQKGWTQGPITGRPMNVDLPQVEKIGKVIKQFSEAMPVDDAARAAAIARQSNGVVIQSEFANDLLPQFQGGNALRPGTYVVVSGLPLDARTLTQLETRIDNELKMAVRQGGKDDAVWDDLNANVKEIRDKFPLWRDANGNLVAPPGWQGAGGQAGAPGGPGAAGGGQPGGGAGQPGTAGAQPGSNVAQGQFVDSEPVTPLTESDPVLGRRRPSLPEGQRSTQGEYEQALAEQRARDRGRYRRLPPSEPGAQLDLTEEQVRALSGGRSEAPPPPSVESEPVTPLSMLAGNRLAITDEGITASRAPQLTSHGQSPQGRYENALREQQARERTRNPRLAGPSGRPLSLTPEQEAAILAEQARRGGPSYEGPPSPPVDQAADTPRSLLAGNRLAITDEGIHQQPEVRVVRGGDTEPLVRPPQRPDEVSAPESRGPLERLLDKGLGGEPDVNIEPVTPSAAQEVAQQGEAWFEDIVAPGAPARSAEAKRMLDLTNQHQEFEQATAQVNNIDRRIGPIPPEDKLQMVLQVLSQKLGREVTKEDLIRAGFITGGGAALIGMDEDQRRVLGAPLVLAMAAARRGGGQGGGGQPPHPVNTVPPAHPNSMLGQQQAAARAAAAAAQAAATGPSQPRVTLPNGRTVEGFSAARHQQHERLNEIEEGERVTGASHNQTLRNNIIDFNRGNNLDVDRALLEEAQRVGKEGELWEVPATAVYPGLDARSGFASGRGMVNNLRDFGYMRADKLLELLSGAERNPFARIPEGLLQMLARQGLNLRGGRVGARHGGDATRIWELLNGTGTEPENEERGNERR